MKNKDLIASLVFLSLAIFLYTYSSAYPVKEGASLVNNPGFYPQLLSVIMGILSFLLMIDVIRKKNIQSDSSPAEKKPFFKTRGSKLFVLTLSLLILYPFSLNFLGFATAAFVFIFIMITALTENAKSRIFVISGISILITTVMFLVFKVVLRIPFPAGLLI